MSPVRPRSPAPNKILPAVHFSYNPAGQNHIALPRRGTQVVRERSAKPLCVGSIPTRASKLLDNLHDSRLLLESPHGVLKAPHRILELLQWRGDDARQVRKKNSAP